MSCADILALYPVLHEAGPDAFAGRKDERLARALPETRLARLRAAAGLTQRRDRADDRPVGTVVGRVIDRVNRDE